MRCFPGEGGVREHMPIIIQVDGGKQQNATKCPTPECTGLLRGVLDTEIECPECKKKFTLHDRNTPATRFKH
jgi:hypothetical protein